MWMTRNFPPFWELKLINNIKDNCARRTRFRTLGFKVLPPQMCQIQFETILKFFGKFMIKSVWNFEGNLFVFKWLKFNDFGDRLRGLIDVRGSWWDWAEVSWKMTLRIRKATERRINRNLIIFLSKFWEKLCLKSGKLVKLRQPTTINYYSQKF